MRTNSRITEERLRKSVGQRSGCTPLYLRVLKSDLHGLLSQYMSVNGIDFSLLPQSEGYNLRIDVSVEQFNELGMTDEG